MIKRTEKEKDMALPEKIPMPPTPAALPAGNTPMEILARAIATGASPDTITKLMDLQERWERNLARKAFDAAIAAAKAKFKPIIKNQSVRFGSGAAYQHEDLAEIENSIRDALAEQGLSYRFRTAFDDKAKLVTVTCVVAQKEGYSEENGLSGPVDVSGSKNAIQAIGSTVTYLQRYTLKAALGLSAAKDDDGNAATPVQPPPKPAPLKTAEHVNPETGEIEHAQIRPKQLPVLEMAREAARHGKEQMKIFWKGLTPAEQKQVNAIRSELDDIVDKAEAEGENRE